MEAIGDVMAPRKRKRHVFRSSGPPAEYHWTPNNGHVHALIEEHVHFAGAELVIDKCTIAGCDYERGRDLLTSPKGDTHDQNTQ